MVFYGKFRKNVEKESNEYKKYCMVKNMNNTDLSASIRPLSNSEIIREHSDELKALFANYEFSRINLGQLREGIKNLGIKETPKTLLLYREVLLYYYKPFNLKYSDLIISLTKTEDENIYDKPAGLSNKQVVSDYAHYDNIKNNNVFVEERRNPFNWNDDIPPLPEHIF